MACCCSFSAAVDAQFTAKRAAQELKRYRQDGPGVTTRFLRDGLTQAGWTEGTLLDIGAGVGALTFELLDRGVTSAAAVDASPQYLEAAQEEAARRGRANAISFVHGDFVDVERQLPIADIVTLDRVVCCYPNYKPLLERALRHAARTFALSYPRDRWFVRLAVRAENTVRWLTGNPFRTVVHPVDEMQLMIRNAGFAQVSRSQTVAWAADVYARMGSDVSVRV
jgi:SAM-dependent methyltransferase